MRCDRVITMAALVAVFAFLAKHVASDKCWHPSKFHSSESRI